MLAGAQAPGLTASRRAPGSALFFEQQNRQPFIGIGEVFDRAEVEETELFLEPDRIEFSTDLHQDFLIFPPAKGRAYGREPDFVFLNSGSVHFNLLPFRIEP